MIEQSVLERWENRHNDSDPVEFVRWIFENDYYPMYGNDRHWVDKDRNKIAETIKDLFQVFKDQH